MVKEQKFLTIIKPSVGMKAKPSRLAPLETECLFGEKIEILDKNLSWVYCRLVSDKYYGWIKKETIGLLEEPTHRVISIRTFLFTHKSEKSTCLHYLSLGSKLNVKKIENNWAEVILPNAHNNETAYVPSKHIVPINSRIDDWVSIAESLTGTPYKWGGRDTIGIDCSALLQLAYETYGQIIPRNSIDQLQLPKKKVTDIKKLKRGFVIFWVGHVGIMTNELNCIHANAYHMCTVVEPLRNIIGRMSKKNQIIKIMDFN